MASNQNQTSIRAVFGALFLALWLAALDQTVVSTALPTMVGDLGVELPLLDGDGLSAHQHGRRPALRKIRRPLRPQDRPASGDLGVSRPPFAASRRTCCS